MIPHPTAVRLSKSLTRLHWRVQAGRFVGTFVATFLTFLGFAAHTAYDWKILGAAALASAEAAINQVWPTLPVKPVIAAVQASLRRTNKVPITGELTETPPPPPPAPVSAPVILDPPIDPHP